MTYMKVKLKSVELIEEDGQFYLDAIYLKESGKMLSEIHVPRIEIPFVRTDTDIFPNSRLEISRATSCQIMDDLSINVGRGYLRLRPSKGPNGEECAYWEQILETELTLEDVEKYLGYKVKIVGEVGTDA